MYEGDHEAKEHQEEGSADTAAVNHGGCEGLMSDGAESLQNSSSGVFEWVTDTGEEQEGSTGEW